MRKSRSSKFFRKLLATYLSVFLIPLAGLLGVAYAIVEAHATTQILEEQGAALARLSEDAERRFLGLTAIADQIRRFTVLSPVSADTHPREAEPLIKELSKCASTGSFVEDVFYGVRKSQLVYGSQSVYGREVFDGIIRSDSDATTEVLSARLDSVVEAAVIAVQATTDSQQVDALFFVIPQFAGRDHYGWIAFLVRRSEVGRLVEQHTGDQRGETTVFDSSGGTVLGPSVVVDENDPLAPESDGRVVSNHEIAPTPGWYFVHSVSRLELRQMTADERAIVVLAGSLVAAIGSGLVLLLLRRTYNPLSHLKGRIERAIGHSLDQPDEIEAIRSGIENLAAEADSGLAAQLSLNDEAIQDYLLLCLLSGNAEAVLDLQEHATNVGFVVENRPMCVVIVECRWQSSSEWDAKTQTIDLARSLLEQSFDVAGKPVADPDKVVLVLAAKEPDEILVMRHLEMLKQALLIDGAASVTMGVGRFSSDPSLVPRSYLEAASALEYRFVAGRNTTILYSDVAEMASELDSYPHEELAEIEHAILRGDGDETTRIAHSMLEDVRRKRLSLLTARCLCFDVVNSCMRSVRKVGVAVTRLQHRSAVAEALARFDTMDELVNVVLASVDDVCEAIARAGVDAPRRQQLASTMEDYIRIHFNEPDFNLVRLSDHLGLSPSSMSHLYRSVRGSTLQEFVQSTRMERSKELLESGYPLKAVVPMIGLQDVSSFIRRFRKVYGMTPGEYARVNSHGGRHPSPSRVQGMAKRGN